VALDPRLRGGDEAGGTGNICLNCTTSCGFQNLVSRPLASNSIENGRTASHRACSRQTGLIDERECPRVHRSGKQGDLRRTQNWLILDAYSSLVQLCSGSNCMEGWRGWGLGEGAGPSGGLWHPRLLVVIQDSRGASPRAARTRGRLPQDEVFLNAIKEVPHPEVPREARPRRTRDGNAAYFFHARKRASRATDEALQPLFKARGRTWTPAFAGVRRKNARW
jgi:hypothetical protein